jgi:hypothetical protein
VPSHGGLWPTGRAGALIQIDVAHSMHTCTWSRDIDDYPSLLARFPCFMSLRNVG